MKEEVIAGTRGWAELSRAYRLDGMEREAFYAIEMHEMTNKESRHMQTYNGGASLEYRTAVALLEKEWDCTDDNVLPLSDVLSISMHLMLRLAKEEWRMMEASMDVTTDYSNETDQFGRILSQWFSDRGAQDYNSDIRRE